jgi:hypothetical protein
LKWYWYCFWWHFVNKHEFAINSIYLAWSIKECFHCNYFILRNTLRNVVCQITSPSIKPLLPHICLKCIVTYWRIVANMTSSTQLFPILMSAEIRNSLITCSLTSKTRGHIYIYLIHSTLLTECVLDILHSISGQTMVCCVHVTTQFE